MDYLQIAIQIIVGVGLLNVWLFRPKKNTPYRGGEASDMKEDFSEYDLPRWFMWVVGAVKVSAAVALLVGIAVPSLVMPASIVLAVLMLGAVVMHLKVRDPLKRSVPATAVLALTLFLAVSYS